MLAREKQKLIQTYETSIGTFEFYPNITIGVIKEGAHVTFENALVPLQMAVQMYGDDKPVVYISHRLHSYSFDPIGYRDAVRLFPNLIGFAIVANSRRKRMLVALERLFMKKTIEVFDDLDGAFAWAEKMLENEMLD